MCRYMNLQEFYFNNYSTDQFTNHFNRKATNHKLSKLPVPCNAHLYCYLISIFKKELYSCIAKYLLSLLEIFGFDTLNDYFLIYYTTKYLFSSSFRAILYPLYCIQLVFLAYNFNVP